MGGTGILAKSCGADYFVVGTGKRRVGLDPDKNSFSGHRDTCRSLEVREGDFGFGDATNGFQYAIAVALRMISLEASYGDAIVFGEKTDQVLYPLGAGRNHLFPVVLKHSLVVLLVD